MSLISVILPSCDSQAWIAEAVDSVLKQTHQQLELIVVDDHSLDNTLSILNGFTGDPRITIIKRSQRSGGPATPRNDGIRIATGDYLAFIDSDDVWHPEKLELQLQAMTENGLNFLSSLHTPFTHRTPEPQLIDKRGLNVERKNHRQLLSKNWVITSSALVSRGLFNDIRFDQAPEYVGVEDYLVWLYIHQRRDIQSAVLKAPLVLYRLRQNSISSSKMAMAAKIYYLLSHYRIADKPLGIKRFYFYCTYAMSSIITRVTRRRER